MHSRLGHGLIRAQPYFDSGEFEHGEVVGRVLLVACGYPPEVLDLAEEAFDVVPLLVEPGTEAGFPAAVAHGGDVRGRAGRLDGTS